MPTILCIVYFTFCNLLNILGGFDKTLEPYTVCIRKYACMIPETMQVLCMSLLVFGAKISPFKELLFIYCYFCCRLLHYFIIMGSWRHACSSTLKVKLVPPSFTRSFDISPAFRFILQYLL